MQVCFQYAEILNYEFTIPKLFSLYKVILQYREMLGGLKMGIVKINHTGSKLPVYETNGVTKQIGTIYPNELFTWISEWKQRKARVFIQKLSEVRMRLSI